MIFDLLGQQHPYSIFPLMILIKELQDGRNEQTLKYYYNKPEFQ